ncbi:hypothetical protein AGMMS49587_16600 [Spirochaetia bacterium]|nr:hypothetical protein AGMMS49587_16600 [Spirochaetia bacterium]
MNMSIFNKKKAALSRAFEGLDAEAAARHEALYMRIHEVGGVENLDKLKIRDIPEAITLCQILCRSMKHPALMCLQNFLSSLYCKADQASVDAQAAAYKAAGNTVMAEAIRAWRGTDPLTKAQIYSVFQAGEIYNAVGRSMEDAGIIERMPDIAGQIKPTEE